MRSEKSKTEETGLALSDWGVVETRPSLDENPVRETVFSIANGYIGLRGSHEEGFAALSRQTADATYINGFYDTAPVIYTESGYGWPKDHQFMLKVPDGKGVSFSFAGEEFDLFKGSVLHYERSLDFQSGILSRTVLWRSEHGAELLIESRRIASLRQKHLYALEYQITAKNQAGRLVLCSSLNGDDAVRAGKQEERYGPGVSGVKTENLQLISCSQSQSGSQMIHRTGGSRFTIVSAVENRIAGQDGGRLDCSSQSKATGQKLETIFTVELKPDETVRLTKYGVYFTSKEPPSPAVEQELAHRAARQLKEAAEKGFAALVEEQKEFLSQFFERAAIEIEGSDSLHVQSLMQGVRFSQFHLMQSVGRDGETSMAAKGLTGDGYGGHYFWDAETYAFPFFLYTDPQIALGMLEYRYKILDKARERARELGHEKGALFSWRTIGGEESSTYFPAGTAAYHINADVAYAIKQYYEATGDESFLVEFAAEILIETARIWLGIGHFTGAGEERFNIDEVTGPDEYTALVNNNFYTNAMARDHLRFAVKVADLIKEKHAPAYEKLLAATGLEDGELKAFATAAERMYLPSDERLGVHAQDDSFLSKKKWDLAATPADRFPLARFYHYLVIYRHQVLKQADVVLALFLLGDQFDQESKRRDFDYYEAITTHDSSLSRCTYSIIASEVGYHDKAYRYFVERLRGDLDNQYSDCSHGVHIAAMAGNWMAIVNGFGGMRVWGGRLSFAPYLPEKWTRYSFRVTFRGCLVEVAVDCRSVSYRLVEGDSLTIEHRGQSLALNGAKEVKVAAARDTTPSARACS